MFGKKITNFIFSIGLLTMIVLSVFSVSMAQAGEATANEPIAMLIFSVQLIAAGFFIRRFLRG